MLSGKCMIDVAVAIFVLMSISMCGKARANCRQDNDLKRGGKLRRTSSQSKQRDPAPKQLGNVPTREDEGMETQTLNEEKKEKPTARRIDGSSRRCSISSNPSAESERRSRLSPMQSPLGKDLAAPSPLPNLSRTESSKESMEVDGDVSERKRKVIRRKLAKAQEDEQVEEINGV